MPVEIINTSNKPLTEELELALKLYAPYHQFEEKRNRITLDTVLYYYDVLAAFVKVDSDHIVVWISDWYQQARFKG